MTKLTVVAFMVVFWMTFPLAMTLMYSNCFQTPVYDQYNSLQEPTAFDVFAGMWNYIKVIFQIMFLGIPCAPAWLKLITYSMTIITGLSLYLFVRGD